MSCEQTSCNVFLLILVAARSCQTSPCALHLIPLSLMEAIALKVAGDVVSPAGTYIYEAMKKQTGRAKFEKGKNSLQDGFALLRDEKSGGLLPAQERLELLRTHAKYSNFSPLSQPVFDSGFLPPRLVADREDVDEITNTFYGSLVHRNTAKEFRSRAKKFCKDVETPAEKAQMEYALHKAEQEVAAETNLISEKSGDMEISQQRNNTASEDIHASTKLKPATGLTRAPTIPDYPTASGFRPGPPKPIENQRTSSASIQNPPIGESSGEVKHNMGQRRSRNALADTSTTRSPPLITSTSLPESGGEQVIRNSRQRCSRNALSDTSTTRPPPLSTATSLPGECVYHTSPAQTTDVSQTRKHKAATRALHFQPAASPLPTRESTCSSVSRGPKPSHRIMPASHQVAQENQFSDRFQHCLKQSRSRIALTDTSPNRIPLPLPKLSEQESSYNTAPTQASTHPRLCILDNLLSNSDLHGMEQRCCRGLFGRNIPRGKRRRPRVILILSRGIKADRLLKQSMVAAGICSPSPIPRTVKR
ncbi:hypothetical protein B0H13DRAFT_1985066 [Mycena leptocephala]|nr:hypothetical protein B0H13DRAFT_1985066 [Mycena leptocephala]